MPNILSDKNNVVVDDRQEEQTGRLIFWLLLMTCALTLFGIIMLYSTSYYDTDSSKYYVNQMIWTGAGFGAGAFVFIFGFRRLSQWSLVLIVGAILMLLAARFCFPPIKGAYRWIQIPIPGFPVSIQPSELAKLALAVFFSRYCAERFRTINQIIPRNLKEFYEGPLPGIGVGLLLAACVYLGKDLGTTLLMFSVMGLVLFCTGMKLRFLVPPVLIFSTGGFFLLRHFSTYRWDRMTIFLDPEKHQLDEGYQLWHSFLAFGSGSWTGLGLSQSRLKANYLPEAHTDFIMSIVGEELGFLTMLIVLFAYFIFIVICARISIGSPTRQGMLLGTAVTGTLGLQSIINIGVACGAFPTKGMPAPFISYGGSSMLVCMISVGILFSIAMETLHPNYNDDIFAWFKSKLLFFKKAGSSHDR
jgi:cell division protein FtsW